MYIHIYIWIYLQPTYSYHFGDLPTANAQTREVKGDLQPLYDYVLVKSKDCVASRAMGNPRPGLGKWESDGAIYPLKMVMGMIYGGLMELMGFNGIYPLVN